MSQPPPPLPPPPQPHPPLALPSPDAAAAAAAAYHKRRVRIQLFFLALTVLLPLVLTLIPLHPPVDTLPVSSSQCNSARGWQPVYPRCALSDVCCPIDRSLLNIPSTRCTLDDSRCYVPVLGTWGVAAWYCVAALVWCVVGCCGWCYCLDAEEAAQLYRREVQQSAVGAVSVVVSDASQFRYQRMNEEVEMR